MKNLILIVLVLITGSAYAQPIIAQQNMPITGDSINISICGGDTVGAGSAGANQTWDMSHLTETQVEYFKYINVSTAPKKDSFPNANLCAVSADGNYSFYNSSTAGLTTQGFVVPMTPPDSTLLVYTNPEKTLNLPLNFGDAYVDTVAGTSHIPSVGSLPFDGTFDFECDGHGTLILPNGTFTKVLRYKFHSTQTNYFGGFPTTTTTKDQWGWLSEDHRFWLLLMETTFDGFSNSSRIWYAKNPQLIPTSVKNNTKTINAVYPNPAKAGQELQIKWTTNEPAMVELYSMDGKLINTKTVHFNSGFNAYRLPELTDGVYMLRIKTDDEYYTQRISITH